MVIDEPVIVELVRETPVRFVWRGVPYGVVGEPERWLRRREAWWRGAPRAARGAAPPLDRAVWRVDAIPLAAGLEPLDGVFDLARLGAGWRLEQAWNPELEMRLFA
ncbi:DUF6504 family protein [Gulosibacter sp. 10]|uniref:DUF6504 family protein n=1 Tax=Gulosibacter sp. 10 TaxID=1255570 RepID=UPI00097E88C1|nr:DUF6504 family protein [Gulosibacter sp. 10]SJM63956.1 hypothetical protein FM112_09650 [Gulosibacter sp. 10]